MKEKVQVLKEKRLRPDRYIEQFRRQFGSAQPSLEEEAQLLQLLLATHTKLELELLRSYYDKKYRRKFDTLSILSMVIPLFSTFIVISTQMYSKVVDASEENIDYMVSMLFEGYKYLLFVILTVIFIPITTVMIANYFRSRRDLNMSLLDSAVEQLR